MKYMAKNREGKYFKESLFQPEHPKPGDEGCLAPGFHKDETTGEIVNDEGDIFDEAYNLIVKAPDEAYKKGLAIAERQNREWNKNWPQETIEEMARFYAHKFRTEAQQKEKEARKKKK